MLTWTRGASCLARWWGFVRRVRVGVRSDKLFMVSEEKKRYVSIFTWSMTWERIKDIDWKSLPRSLVPLNAYYSRPSNRVDAQWKVEESLGEWWLIYVLVGIPGLLYILICELEPLGSSYMHEVLANWHAWKYCCIILWRCFDIRCQWVILELLQFNWKMDSTKSDVLQWHWED